jgi:hypothetical protein
LLCEREGKWAEIPYVQLFFFLKEHPQCVEQCKGDAQPMVCKTSSKEGDISNATPVTPKESHSPLSA